MTLSASSGRAQPRNSFTISTGSGRPSSSRWSRKKTGHSLSSTRYSGEEEMAAWMSLSTGSPRIQTGNFESHHLTHVKRGVVRCLHGRVREVISTQDNLQKEVDHLARVLKQNGYPANFIRNASAPPTQETADISSPEEEQEKGPLVVIPYVTGMSEDIRRVCRKFNIRVVFKSGWTLRSMLTKVKDTLPPGKQSNVVYRIPCSCGQVYIGETNGDWRRG